MKRILGIIALTLLSAACATQPTVEVPEPQEFADPEPGDFGPMTEAETPPEPQPKKSWKDKYVGISGHFTRPPIFLGNEDKLLFQRCVPFTITGVDVRKGNVILKLRQGRNVIQVTGLNRKAFKLSAKQKLPLLNQYFVKRLDFLSGSGRQIASQKQSACDGQMWPKMSKREFLFVSGDPDQVKKETSAEGPHEKWVYQGHSADAPSVSYFFRQGVLYSWTK